MEAERLADRLRAALHPLEAPPAAAPWNLMDLDGLAPDASPRPPFAMHVETRHEREKRRGARHHWLR